MSEVVNSFLKDIENCYEFVDIASCACMYTEKGSDHFRGCMISTEYGLYSCFSRVVFLDTMKLILQAKFYSPVLT